MSLSIHPHLFVIIVIAFVKIIIAVIVNNSNNILIRHSLPTPPFLQHSYQRQ